MFDRNRPYEPLTSDNAALVLVDHQVGLMTGVRDMSPSELKHNVVGLAKAGKALKLPIVVTTTARDSMWGPTFPELVEALPGVQIIDRGSVNAFDDAPDHVPERLLNRDAFGKLTERGQWHQPHTFRQEPRHRDLPQPYHLVLLYSVRRPTSIPHECGADFQKRVLRSALSVPRDQWLRRGLAEAHSWE